jgi:hypothetical protein
MAPARFTSFSCRPDSDRAFSLVTVSQGQSLGFDRRVGRIPRPAPQPLARVAAQPGSDGVGEHVADRRRQVLLVLDHPRREPLLEQMAFAPVSSIEPLCVDPEEAMHCEGEPLPWPLDDQMEVGAYSLHIHTSSTPELRSHPIGLLPACIRAIRVISPSREGVAADHALKLLDLLPDSPPVLIEAVSP